RACPGPAEVVLSAPRHRLSIDQTLPWPALETALDAHDSAAAALDAGDYCSAFELARQEGAAEPEAVALLMCGWVERALAGLENRKIEHEATHSYIAFGRWCLGENTAPSFVVPEENRKTRLLLIAGKHTERGIPDPLPGDFDIRFLVLARDEKAPPAENIIGKDPLPDAVILLDVYGPRVPEGIFDLGVPVIFWSYDFDFHLPSQYEDLAQTDVILCASVGEYFQMRRIYPGRIATMPAHDIYTDAARFTNTPGEPEFDLVHTGVSFSPMMLGKAQYLFHQAVTGEDDARIQLVQGFLGNTDYRELIGKARNIAVFDRFSGGLQTRAMDAACAGTAICTPEGVGAHSILRMAGVAFAKGEPTPEAEYNLRQIFPASPDREIRFLKYCLFQLALLKGDIRFAPPRPTPKPPTFKKSSHTNACRTALRLIHAFADEPMDANIRARLDNLIERVTGEYESSVPLNFNLARYLWAIEDKIGATTLLDRLCQTADRGQFEPARNDIRIHLLPVASELTPYDAYFMALARDLSEGMANAPTARRIITASAHCFLGLDHLQGGRLEAGTSALETALQLFPGHFPAARLHVRALYAAEAPPGKILDAIYMAVGLYGPYLTELLPIAIACHKDLDDLEGALALVKIWCRFATRVHWIKPDEHPISSAIWPVIAPYLKQLPEKLVLSVRALEEDQSRTSEY
ncbi:MAG: hypothetical protein VYE18_01765, partial [Pseudomonadota bacterium]|nr:hypothetical protein [Pseudomonadota bacterium]